MTVRIIALLLTLLLSSDVFAQRFSKQIDRDGLRNKNWETSLYLVSQSGSGITGENGSTLDVDSDTGWGFSFGYNLTNKWNFQYKFTLVKPDYSATIVPEEETEPPQTIDYNMSKYSNQLNATYNFLEGRWSPFVQAGVGWTKLDSNIVDRPPVTGCWWDPWWGYICSTTWTTYDTTRFSYNAGVGVRWDINGALFSRLAFNREWVDLKSGTMDFDTISIDLGFMW